VQRGMSVLQCDQSSSSSLARCSKAIEKASICREAATESTVSAIRSGRVVPGLTSLSADLAVVDSTVTHPIGDGCVLCITLVEPPSRSYA